MKAPAALVLPLIRVVPVHAVADLAHEDQAHPEEIGVEGPCRRAAEDQNSPHEGVSWRGVARVRARHDHDRPRDRAVQIPGQRIVQIYPQRSSFPMPGLCRF